MHPFFEAQALRLAATSFGMGFLTPLRFAHPFTGIDAVGRVLELKRWPGLTNNVAENDKVLTSWLRSRFGPAWMPRDFSAIPMAEFEDADAVIMGPPCQPFSRLGSQLGMSDPRSALFLQGIDLCEELHKRGDLKLVVIENSPKILERMPDGRTPFDKIQEYWGSKMPAWLPLKPWVLDAWDHATGMSRSRVFLLSTPEVFKRVFNRNAASGDCNDLGFPPPASAPTRTRLVDQLDYTAEELCVGKIKGPVMKANYKHWKKVWRAKVTDQPGAFATGAVDLCRNVTKKFNTYLTMDAIPSPTRSNYSIVVFGTGAEGKVGMNGRMVTNEERARVVGFDYAELRAHMTPRQVSAALGNSIAINVLAAVMESAWSYLDAVKSRAESLKFELPVTFYSVTTAPIMVFGGLGLTPVISGPPCQPCKRQRKVILRHVITPVISAQTASRA